MCLKELWHELDALERESSARELPEPLPASGATEPAAPPAAVPDQTPAEPVPA